MEDLADGELEAVPAFHLADDRELRAVRRPIRVAHAFENGARDPPGERHPGQCPQEQTLGQIGRVREQGQLALRRDGEQVLAGVAERLRLGVFGPDDEDGGGVALERGAIDDRASVGTEARHEDHLRLQIQLAEGGLGDAGLDSLRGPLTARDERGQKSREDDDAPRRARDQGGSASDTSALVHAA